MFIIYAIALGILIGYLGGGSLKWLISRVLAKKAFAFTAIAIQLVIFSGFPFVKAAPSVVISIFHIISYICLIVFIIYNIRIPGIAVICTGALLNSLVIFLNGGFMPSNSEFMKTAAEVDNNIIGISEGTRLAWLGDIFHLPAWLPLSRGFSIGDVLIAVGTCVYFVLNMKKPVQNREDAR